MAFFGVLLLSCKVNKDILRLVFQISGWFKQVMWQISGIFVPILPLCVVIMLFHFFDHVSPLHGVMMILLLFLIPSLPPIHTLSYHNTACMIPMVLSLCYSDSSGVGQ